MAPTPKTLPSILKANHHELLTEYVVKLLNKNNIFCAFDFISHDPDYLTRVTNLSFLEVCIVKCHLRKNFSIIPNPDVIQTIPVGGEFSMERIPTGISSLDRLLGGGLMPGTITELCGYLLTGKTQLCYTIAANLAERHMETFILDSKQKGSFNNVYTTLMRRTALDPNSAEFISRLHVHATFTMRQMQHSLQYIDKELEYDSDKIRLVIIDSISNLIAASSTENLMRVSVIVSVSQMLRQIVMDHNAAVLVVSNAGFQEPSQPADWTTGTKWADCAALGEVWSRVPQTLLLISDVEGAKRSKEVRVIKSSFLDAGAEPKCIVQWNERGTNIICTE